MAWPRRLAAEANAAASPADTDNPVTTARMNGAEVLRSLRTEADLVPGIADRLREAAGSVTNPTATTEAKASATVLTCGREPTPTTTNSSGSAPQPERAVVHRRRCGGGHRLASAAAHGHAHLGHGRHRWLCGYPSAPRRGLSIIVSTAEPSR